MSVLPVPILTVTAVSFASSVLATALVRRVARSRGCVEAVRPDRWHSQPTARFGGVGILCGLVAGAVGYVEFTPAMLGLAALAAVLFAAGLADDVFELRPQSKLVLQIAAGGLLYFAGFHFNTALPWAVDFFVVVFWVVAITTAMNLLDNMDGLAAGIAVIAGVFRLLLFLADGNTQGAVTSAVFVGAVAGFLVFNFSPASIFMGDCGSLLIGFVLAALNLTTSQMYAKNLMAVLLFPSLVLAIPIFDTAFVSVVRWLSGRSMAQGGTDHASHRLVAVGLSERQAVLVLYALAATSGSVAYFLYQVGFSYAWFGGAMFLLAFVLFGIVLSTISVYPEEELPADSVVRDAPRFTMATDWPYKRAMLWVVIDLIALVLAYYAAFLLRYAQTAQWADQLPVFIRTVPAGVACLLIGVSSFGLYRTDWQSFSLHEAKAIVKGVTVGTLVQALLMATVFDQGLGALLVSVVSWGAAVLALTGSRGVVRALADSLRREHARGNRALIYGVGAGGELVLRELRANPVHGMHVVGFLDDDPARRRTLLHGVAVVGTAMDAPRLVRECEVAAVVVATQKVPDDRLARLVRDVSAVGGSVYRFTFRLEPLSEPEPATKTLTPAMRD